MNKERGYISLLILITVLVMGVWFLNPIKTPPFAQKQVCTLIDASKKKYFNNRSYTLIRGVSPLSTEQFRYHVNKQEETIDGKPVYTPKSNCQLVDLARQRDPRIPDPIRDAILTPTPGYITQCADDQRTGRSRVASVSWGGLETKELLFIENPSVPHQPGFIFTEIYISDEYLQNSSGRLPDFIEKDYCNQNFPVDPKLIFPNKNGEIVPPPYIFTNQIQFHPGKPRPEGSIYTIFAYQNTATLWGDTYAGGLKISANPNKDPDGIGKYIYGSGSTRKTYTVRIVSYAQYLSLVDDEDNTLVYLYSKEIPTPQPAQLTPTPRQKLQIDKINAFVLQPWGWWSPECKPAVYLYPEQTTSVSVEIRPKGYLTYTDPPYPPSGWHVMAHPSGRISTQGKEYEYLYYESKIKDVEIQKPTKGYVVRFDELVKLYTTILPQLGLSDKETQDFKDYWLKVLPYSPYYFVGIMEPLAIEKIEPLTITPKPTTIIRVRLYFEAQDTIKVVEPPVLVAQKRNGFTVSEWGGIVKVDKNHPFSCSQ